MRIAIDYRPALRGRTGIGEYIHQIAHAMARTGGDTVTVFTSSWKDRPPANLFAELPNVTVVDRRIPVSILNLCWHRLRWPPIETLTGRQFDIAHSPHPLLLPARSAAHLVTIHDLHFLSYPEHTNAEIRRDYPALAATHARMADRIIVSSRFAAGEVSRALEVPADKIAVCPAGAPEWKTPAANGGADGYILFLGTLDRRKNIDGLIDSYGRLLARSTNPGGAPRLVIAGHASPGSAQWLHAVSQPPFAGHVEYLGYVHPERREAVFKGAQMFVLPSFEEGFGLPALEAMSAGVPVIASNRGALPEVVGDAGLLIDPDDPESLTSAMARMTTDGALRHECTERGLARARQFSWQQTARDVHRAYEDATLARRHRLRLSHPSGRNSHAHRH